MKKTLVLGALLSCLACIDWEGAEAMGRQQRCRATPTEPGCQSDSGTGGGGGGGGGTATGGGAADSGIDAGLGVLWGATFPFEALFLVGGSSDATLVGFGDGGLDAGWGVHLRPVAGAGPRPNYLQEGSTSLPTAAFERDGTLVVAFDDRRVTARRHVGLNYGNTIVQSPSFVTTAVDLYPFDSGASYDGGLAVAAYGVTDGGGLGVTSFVASSGGTADGTTTVSCMGTVRPWRVLPAPDASVGVVVGSVAGMCGSPLDVSAPGGFVGRFGTGGNSGFSFPAQTAQPMALGLVDNELRLAFRAASDGGELVLASVPSTGAGLNSVTPILLGDLTPVDLVDPGPEFFVVGHGRGLVSLIDGGSAVTMNGQDVFIARVNASSQVVELRVFNDPGDQTVVGAIQIGGNLVLGGNCDGGRFCAGTAVPKAWLAGFAP